MPILVLGAVGLIALLIVSRKLRAVVLHVRVRQFVMIFVVISTLACLGGLAYYAWKIWWPIYMSQPTMGWSDETIEQEANPMTPGAGGPAKPTEIQVR